MNKEWVGQANKRMSESMAKEYEEILSAIENATMISPENRLDFLDKFKSGRYVEASTGILFRSIDFIDDDEKQEEYKFCVELSNRISDYGSKIDYDGPDHCYDHYLDSESMEFDGDIIITDPCYIRRRDTDDEFDYFDDEYMKSQGFQNYMLRDTLYGDWSCTTYNTDTGDEIGEFCADAGMVAVFLLDEVLKYNPRFDYHINKQWTTTLIKDFKGTVQFVVGETTGVYDEDTKYHRCGDTWVDYSVEVIGHGINKVTGEPINFVGRQTGF